MTATAVFHVSEIGHDEDGNIIRLVVRDKDGNIRYQFPNSRQQ